MDITPRRACAVRRALLKTSPAMSQMPPYGLLMVHPPNRLPVIHPTVYSSRSRYPDPDRLGGNGWLIMTEVLNADGTPHESNGRATISDDDNDFWFGFEQEYTIMDRTPIFLASPRAIPVHRVRTHLRRHAERLWSRTRRRAPAAVLEAGIERRRYQWRGNDGPVGVPDFCREPCSAGDQIWLGRYLLERTAEKYGLVINLHPKPIRETGTDRVCTPTFQTTPCAKQATRRPS